MKKKINKPEEEQMAFDYKKEYKEFYMPKAKPEIVTVPKMNYIAVRGSGDPNAEDGDYKAAVGLFIRDCFYNQDEQEGATIRLRGILIMWFPRWKVSGGRMACPGLITVIRKIFSGSP